MVEDEVTLEERVAVKWLADYDREAGLMMNKQTLAQWSYGANITDYNQEAMVNTIIHVHNSVDLVKGQGKATTTNEKEQLQKYALHNKKS